MALEPPSGYNPDFIPTGDRALAVSESQTVSVAQNAMATAAFSMVKDQVSSFVESSQALMNVLNEVGKVHPFIQSTSKPFCSNRTGHLFTPRSCCISVHYSHQDGINSTRK